MVTNLYNKTYSPNKEERNKNKVDMQLLHMYVEPLLDRSL